MRVLIASILVWTTTGATALADSPWPDEECPTAIPSASTRAWRVSSLRQTIESALVQVAPHAGPVGGGVFSGNYDWHSAVHAHWALLSIARVTHDVKLEKRVRLRLTPEALSRERAFLNSNPTFELPYGQSWLLLMLDELGRRSDVYKTYEFRSLQRDTRDRVIHWLETSSFPEVGGLIGWHQSWLFSYLLTSMASLKDPAAMKRLAPLWSEKINPARDEIDAFEPTDSDFLDLRSVLATVDYIIPGAHPGVFPLGESVAFKSPITSGNAHTAGAAMVRLWPHAIQSSSNGASCSRYQTRMSEMFASPEQWRDRFETVAHWVPQFMWMSLWLEMGRP